jgi:tricorn protease interacting factor F2/3
MASRTSDPGHQTLGRNVVPSRYSLLFEPDMAAFRSRGSETIECTVRNATKRILLNSKEIEIRRASVKSRSAVQAARIRHIKKLERVELALGAAVKGPIEISIDFVCINNDRMYGFYRSSYGAGGRQRHLLTSQFEAANARAAFPCFDEPEFKARFRVSMLVGRGLSAISNMPIKRERRAPRGKKLVEFCETPKMSSYLLYLGAGEFEFTGARLGKLKLRVITTPGKKRFTKLPMEYAKRSVKWLQDYFGVEYPLPKLDLIAIPDFAAGAMENWGAMTFREIALLCDGKTALPNRQYIASVVAHEIVHQWFGDLVTMEWWNDTWLNESFAEFMSHKAINEMYPSWRIEPQYIANTFGAAFAADSLKSTHPISVKVDSVGEIGSIFDAISYQKGGSILYMLEDYVGKGAYRKGLRMYLRKHAYSNATKRDLWDAVQRAARGPGKGGGVSEMIEKWVTLPGHPVVHARKAGNGFSLRQERYTLLGRQGGCWPIPLHYLAAGGASCTLMEREKQRLGVKGSWVKLNYGQKGFYRVRYEPGLLAGIGRLIRDGRISDIDAWGVENDLFFFVRSARMAVDEYLAFVSDYCMDRDYPANSGISGHLNWLCTIGQGHGFGERARKVSIAFHRKMLSRLGWKKRAGDDAVTVLLRSGAISSLGLAGDAGTLARAKKEFRSFMRGGKEIDVDMRGAIYSLGAWQGGARAFDFFLRRYRKEKAPDEQRRNLRALGSFSDPALLRRALRLSSSGGIRLQDSFLLPAAVSANPAGKALVWGWTRRNWKPFMKKYDSGAHMLGGLAGNLSCVSDAKTASEIRRFFARKGNRRDDMEMALGHALEMIEANIRLIRKNGG